MTDDELLTRLLEEDPVAYMACLAELLSSEQGDGELVVGPWPPRQCSEDRQPGQ